jgi:hypothetical protein
MTLIGRWVIDESDQHTLEKFGNVVLEFDEDGGLTYIIRSDGKQQIMLMRYEVDGDTIITDQPSHPSVERTAFSLSDDGLLMLALDGEPSNFRRITM